MKNSNGCFSNTPIKEMGAILKFSIIISCAVLFVVSSPCFAMDRQVDAGRLWPDYIGKEMSGLRKKTVTLNVGSEKMVLTVATPSVVSGNDVGNFEGAFTSITVEPKDGKVTLPLSTVPIYLEEPGIDSVRHLDAESSPFGIQGPAKYDPHFKDLGVHWVRSSGSIRAAWGQIEPYRGKFDMSHVANIDKAISGFNRNNVNTMVTVYVQNPWDQLGESEGRKFWKKWKKNHKKQERRLVAKLPRDQEAFAEFLRRFVERYDGDGIDDAPGSPVVKYWQIVNEADLDWKDTPENFAKLVKISYKAIKKADPNAGVVLSGAALPRGFTAFYQPMLKQLNRMKDSTDDRYFDVFDFHWFVGATGGYLVAPNRHFMGGIGSFKEYVELIRSTLEKYGHPNTPIWITEMCTHTGKPKQKRVKFDYQSETQQAAELVKRFVYPLSLGIERIFWSRIYDQYKYKNKADSFFNHVGLIYNPKKNRGKTVKKLSYYTYKMLINKLEGSDWEKMETLNLGEDVFAFRFTKGGKSIYVMWLR